MFRTFVGLHCFLFRFDTSAIKSDTQVKTSVWRGIRKKILNSYPQLEEDIDGMLPKRTPMYLVKW